MLNNLKMKNKLIVLVLLPTILAIVLSFNLLLNNFTEMKNLEKTEQEVIFATKIGQLVHETQKERGYSAVYIGSKGATYKNEINSQRESSDIKIKAFKLFVNILKEVDVGPEFNQQISTVLNELDKISDVRNKITNLSISSANAISYYTNMNASLLKVVNIIAHASSNMDIFKNIATYEYFLLAKERAGIERAVGARAFTADKFEGGVKVKFTEIITEQKTYLNAFFNGATATSQNYYTDFLEKEEVIAVNKMRTIALSKRTDSSIGINPKEWFGSITKKINSLMLIEKSLEKDMLELITEYNSNIVTQFCILLFIIIISLIILFFVGLKIYLNISSNLDILHKGLISFFQYINKEKADVEILHVTADDEMGQMMKVINHNIENTKKGIENDDKIIAEIITVLGMFSEGDLSKKIDITTHNSILIQLKDVINNMSSNMEKNINDILNILEEYSNANYTNSISTTSVKEHFLRLGTGVNTLGDSITQMLQRNQQDGLVLQESSQELTSNVSTLSNNATSQAASLEETAASVDEITSNIEQTNQKAQSMLSISSDTKSSANDGKILATDTVKAIDEINATVLNISESISVIDQIAFQTNILSLNAAVEAATAGEAGKGFAVVAQEVRNLASRSADAAKDIKDLVEKATEKANNGKSISTKMIEGFSHLEESITETNILIDDVTNAAKEQSIGMMQISDAINKLDSFTQQNASVADNANQIAQKSNQIAMEVVGNVNKNKFNGKK